MCGVGPDLLDRLPGVAWTTDRSLALDGIFGAGLTCFGFRKADYIGRPVQDLFPPSRPTSIHADPYRQALTGRSSTFELEIQGRVLVGRVEPITDPEGHVVGTIALALDDT